MKFNINESVVFRNKVQADFSTTLAKKNHTTRFERLK